MKNLRYQLLSLLFAWATLGTGHAAPMSEATLKILVTHLARCDDARSDPNLLRMNVDFDQYCTCVPKKAEASLRAADWQSPDKPSESDKAKYADLLRNASIICTKPFAKKSMVAPLADMCRAGKGVFQTWAKQGAAVLQATCPCIAEKTADLAFGPDDVALEQNVDMKVVSDQAIEICKAQQ